MECAQAFARKTLESGGGTDETRITYAFRRVLAREPKEAERQELLNLLKKERDRFAEGWLNPSLVATGADPPLASVPPGGNPNPTRCVYRGRSRDSKFG